MVSRDVNDRKMQAILEKLSQQAQGNSRIVRERFRNVH